MSLIFLFSDLHVHAYREFSETLPSGLNSRLADTLDALETVVARAVAQADVLLFGGDFFHKRRVLDVRALNEAHDRLAKVQGVDAYLLRGNHDHATRDGGVHSIHTFRPLVKGVIDQAGVREVHPGVFVNFIPYMDDPKEIKEALKAPRPQKAKTYLCLGHFGVLGAVTGPVEYVPLEPIHLEDLPDNLYDFGFLGHYHRRQKLKDRWWYIGSPLQTSRGERGEDKGFLVYDTDKPEKFTVVPLYFPEFVTLEAADIERGGIKKKVKGNFVDVVLDEEPEGGAEAFKKLLLKAGARAANVVCAPKSKVEAQRLEVHPGLAPIEMAEQYIDEYAGKGIDKEAALEFTRLCLAEAEKAG